MSYCIAAVVQNSVSTDQRQSPNSYYRKYEGHNTLSKHKPRKRVTTMFNVSVYELLAPKNFSAVDVLGPTVRATGSLYLFSCGLIGMRVHN